MYENPHVDMDRPAVAELMADVSAALTQRVSAEARRRHLAGLTGPI